MELLEKIKEQIRNLKYKPSPARRIKIPKDNWKMRKLGIQTVIDTTSNGTSIKSYIWTTVFK